MGCASNRIPPQKTDAKSTNQPKPTSDAKPTSNLVGSQVQSPSKRKYTPEEIQNKQLAQGQSRPPTAFIPKIPQFSFGPRQQEEIYNQILPGSQEPGFSPIYRQKGVKTLLSTPDPALHSVADIIHHCKSKYGSKRGIGQIVVTTQKGPNGEDVEIRTVKEHTYNQIYDTAYNLGKALAHRGLAFKEDVLGMNIFGIYSKNRLQWFITDWACALFGYVLAPLYDSLGKENLAHCISITGTRTLFVSSKTAEQLLKFHQKGTLKTLILFDKLSEELSGKLREEGLELLLYSQLVEEGSRLHNRNEETKINSQDVFSFCFTSGTTGPPKAAMIKNRNILAALVPFVSHKDLGFNSEDVYLSYLPLPHIMERQLAFTMFYVGAFLVISSGNLLKIRDDSAAAHVSVFVSVPRVFNKVVDNVKTTLAQMVTNQADRPALEKVVYAKVRQSFGGKIRVMATGSAPINPAVQQMMQKVMGCPMIEGYGQTESPCGILFSRKTQSHFATMQQLSAGVEVKLADIPEMKYTAKDIDSKGRPSPRGELWVRGPQVFGGYYKMEELSKQTVGVDGWLKTGDVAEITPELAFKIIDRRKNIFKLQQGEYVAPDRVQACYMRSGHIEEIFLDGNSSQNYSVAVITPRKDKLSQTASKLGIVGTFQELCLRREVRYAFLAELNAYVRSQGFSGFQTAKNVYFETVGFASRNILTNTQKMIRFQARNSYKAQIQAMYAEGELQE